MEFLRSVRSMESLTLIFFFSLRFVLKVFSLNCVFSLKICLATNYGLLCNLINCCSPFAPAYTSLSNDQWCPYYILLMILKLSTITIRTHNTTQQTTICLSRQITLPIPESSAHTNQKQIICIEIDFEHNL